MKISETIAVCPSHELLEGEMKNAQLPDGTRVALFNVNGAFYATQDTCTHEDASLSDDGLVEGEQVICGWHFCGFVIATGAAVASPCNEPLRTFPTRVIEGMVHVEY
jgi:p-cumate 2,3-dioxygenase ferredoxin subunit